MLGDGGVCGYRHSGAPSGCWHFLREAGSQVLDWEAGRSGGGAEDGTGPWELQGWPESWSRWTEAGQRSRTPPDETGRVSGEGASCEDRMGEWGLASVSASSHTGVWEGEHFGGSESPKEAGFWGRVSSGAHTEQHSWLPRYPTCTLQASPQLLLTKALPGGCSSPPTHREEAAGSESQPGSHGRTRSRSSARRLPGHRPSGGRRAAGMEGEPGL